MRTNCKLGHVTVCYTFIQERDRTISVRDSKLDGSSKGRSTGTVRSCFTKRGTNTRHMQEDGSMDGIKNGAAREEE